MLTKKSIESIFTLRYDYTSNPFFPHKNILDFKPWDEPSSGWSKHIQFVLELKIWELLNEYNTVGISLSSGLDSTLLLCLIRRIFPKKKIHAYIDDCSGESKEAKEQAKKYNAKIFMLSGNSIFPNINEYVKISGEPRYNVYHNSIAKMAKMFGCDVLVTGDGADELFGGYIFRYHQFSILGDDYLHCHLNDWVEDQSTLINDFNWFNYELMCGKRTISDLNQVLLSDYNGKLLHEFLPIGRKISHYHDIPIITPFMELHNLATHIPIEKKIKLDSRPLGKIILGDIADRIGLLTYEKKIGYSIDIVLEYKKNERKIREKLDNINTHVWDYLNKDWFLIHKKDHDKRIINKIYQTLALGEYLNEQ